MTSSNQHVRRWCQLPPGIFLLPRMPPNRFVKRMQKLTTCRMAIHGFPTQQACRNLQVTCDMYRSLSFILLMVISPGPGPFTITSVSIGANRDLINVTYMEVSHVTIYSYRLCMTLWCEIWNEEDCSELHMHVNTCSTMLPSGLTYIHNVLTWVKRKKV